MKRVWIAAASIAFAVSAHAQTPSGATAGPNGNSPAPAFRIMNYFLQPVEGGKKFHAIVNIAFAQYPVANNYQYGSTVTPFDLGEIRSLDDLHEDHLYDKINKLLDDRIEGTKAADKKNLQDAYDFKKSVEEQERENSGRRP